MVFSPILTKIEIQNRNKEAGGDSFWEKKNEKTG